MLDSLPHEVNGAETFLKQAYGASVSTIIVSKVVVAHFFRVCHCVLVCVKKERHGKQMVSTTKKKCKSMQKLQKVANVSSTATTKMQEVQSIGPH